MANYSLVIGSKYSPFTFDELLKPALMATQAHNELENQYAELSAKANVWEEMADKQTDPYAYSLYERYANDLRTQADALATQGLTPLSRKALLDMKGRYSKEITPIETAYSRRQKLAEEQREARSKDSTMLFDKDIASISLDDLIRNPNLSYSSYSGELLATQVGQAAKALSKEMRANPRKWESILEDQYYETLMQEGYRPEEILLASANDPSAPKELRDIVNKAIYSSGIPQWGNPEVLQKAYDYAEQGLWNAVGESAYQIQQNRGWINPNEDNDETISTGFSPRIIEGVQGEENKDLGIISGLRPTASGFSTNKLDELRRKLESANSALSGYTQSEVGRYEAHMQRVKSSTAKTAPGIGGYASLAKGISESTSVPSGYGEYAKKKGEYERALKDYNDAVLEVNNLIDKYSHLGLTDYERLYIGSKLDTLQQGQEKSSFALNLKDTEYGYIRKGISNVLGSMTKKSIDAGNIGIVNSKGKTLSYKDTEEFRDDINNVSIKITGGNNPEFKMVHKGKEYTIKGIEQLDSYNRDLKVVDNYLKDFSKNIEPYITPISDETYNEIIQRGGIMNVRLSNVNEQPVPNSSYTGTVLYNATSGEYIKILMDRSGNVVAVNSLSDELGGGNMRDEYFINMANVGLNNLMELFAAKN